MHNTYIEDAIQELRKAQHRCEVDFYKEIPDGGVGLGFQNETNYVSLGIEKVINNLAKCFEHNGNIKQLSDRSLEFLKDALFKSVTYSMREHEKTFWDIEVSSLTETLLFFVTQEYIDNLTKEASDGLLKRSDQMYLP